MTRPVRRIVFASLAGQPAAALARVLARAAAEAGLAPALWDPHAVRPGGVETHLDLDARFASPRVAPGRCDLVVGLEVLEGLRQAARFYRPGIHLGLLDVVVPPVAVAHGGKRYPDADALARELAGQVAVHRLPGPGRAGAPAEPVHLASVLGLVAGLAGSLDHEAVLGAARAAFPDWPEADLAAGYAVGRRVAEGARTGPTR
ncbi:MAG TPA: hypothetical protein VF406_16410 [Thermodesulfobacteriota bacterium]